MRLHIKTSGGEHIYDTYVPTFTGDTLEADFSVVNSQTLFVAYAGDKVDVIARADGTMVGLECKFAGELVTIKKKKNK